ncbi:MAG TPA: hypothetical protein PK926_07470 [Spirochaetota bacterium]|nr:hypothetical protein [Spirochaetota bacterium]HPR49821.1 hypothetical protein [Spirochaetota bacterium]
MKKNLIIIRVLVMAFLLSLVPDFSMSRDNQPATPVKLCFIHHSCGSNWLKSNDGRLGIILNRNNYYVTESYYGWSAEPGDNLGNRTDTRNWPLWFNNTKMPYVYKNNSHYSYENTIADPGSENSIIMFKSCYPCSEVGDSIDDEKKIYNELLAYFAKHTDKLFILVTPPGETRVSSWKLTKELCQWLASKNGWLKNYPHKNVGVFDFYCVLSEKGSHHRVKDGSVEYVYAPNYDGVSPYHNNDDHPNSEGNRKAAEEFITILNMYYNNWKK